MSFNPTKEQLDVILEKDSSLFVSASAGSGKTSTMIQRILRIATEEKVDLRQILVLTFTNAAANDMREKLYFELSQNANKNQECFESLFKVASAEIGTIDAFCSKIVKQFFYLADIEPNFRIIDELNATLLKDKAFKKCIEKYYKKNDDDFKNFINSNFEKRNLKQVKSIIYKVFEFMLVCESKNDLVKTTELSHDENLNTNIAFKICLDYAKDLFEDVKEFFEKTINENPAYEIEKYCKLEISKLIKLLEETDSVKQFQLISTYSLPSITTIKIKKGSADYEERDIFYANLLQLNDIVKKAKNVFGAETESQIINLLKLSEESSNFIIKFTSSFENEYLNLKKNQNLMDFNDVENYALFILQNEEARNDIRKKYKYIFMDEFQDINPIQNAIIECVCGEKNSFAVGDPKQSIYGFRLTDPQIFIEKYEHGKNNDNGSKSFDLSTNFRSTREILEFCNHIFSRIMKKNFGGVDYQKDGKFFIEHKQIQFSKEMCEVFVIPKTEKEKKELPEVYSVINATTESEDDVYAEVEAIKTAQIIEATLSKGMNFGDIAILCRSKNDYIRKICAKLKEFGYAIDVGFDDNLAESREANFVHSFVRLCNNFKNDIDLAGVMLSPLFNFSPNELSVVREEFCDEKFFYKCVLNYCKSGKNEKIHTKINDFAQKIKYFYDISKNLNVYEFALKICNEFNVYEIVNKIEGGEESNLVNYLNALKSLNVDKLDEYVELTENGNFRSKAEPDVDSNKIKLTTIHSSKGLEYKVVVLVGAGNKFNESDLKGNVFINKTLGVCAQSIDLDNEEKFSNISKEAAKILKSKEMIAEEIRVFYVALTRAKNKLFIVGSINEKNAKPIKENFRNLRSKSFLEFVFGSLNELQIKKIFDNSEVVLSSSEPFASISCFSKDDAKKEKLEKKPFLLPKEIDKKLCEEFEKQLSKKHNFSHNILSKTSVSRLSKNEKKSDFNVANLSTEELEQKMLEGTIYHKFLELFDFGTEDLKTEKNRVLKLFLSEEKSMLDEKVLDKILASGLINFVKNKNYFKEKKFYFEDENGTIIQGITDLVIVEKDGIIVVDYKTSKAKKDELIKQYKTQLSLYANKCAQILHTKVKKMFIYSIFDANLIEI